MNLNCSIVGVLNVTPDSYFDGGKYTGTDAALARIETLLEEGADIIEFGGESTGPGSSDVSVEEELQRTIPALEAARKAFPEAKFSVDTYKAPVAEAALACGVMMVNDVTAGRGDPDMFPTLSEHECTVVLMYAKDETARTTVEDQQYDDVVQHIVTFLEERIAVAMQAGIARDRIVIDPGMGHFISSDPQYSFEVLRRLQEFEALAPVFVSPSRKSFLAGEENLNTADRLPGTIVASAFAVAHGATYIRTHDVAEVRRGIEVLQEIAC